MARRENTAADPSDTCLAQLSIYVCAVYVYTCMLCTSLHTQTSGRGEGKSCKIGHKKGKRLNRKKAGVFLMKLYFENTGICGKILLPVQSPRGLLLEEN